MIYHNLLTRPTLSGRTGIRVDLGRSWNFRQAAHVRLASESRVCTEVLAEQHLNQRKRGATGNLPLDRRSWCCSGWGYLLCAACALCLGTRWGSTFRHRPEPPRCRPLRQPARLDRTFQRSRNRRQARIASSSGRRRALQTIRQRKRRMQVSPRRAPRSLLNRLRTPRRIPQVFPQQRSPQLSRNLLPQWCLWRNRAGSRRPFPRALW